MVASLARRLKAVGEFENTVFVFSSDNGYSFGSHNWDGKLVPYDETTRVPLAIAGPGIEHGTVADIVAQIDLAPTLYDVADLPKQPDVDGVSLVPFFDGGKPSWRDDLLIEYRAPPNLAFHTFADVRRTAARAEVTPEDALHDVAFVPD